MATLVTLATPCLASSFSIDKSGTFLTLQGEIEPGDAERLVQLYTGIQSIGGIYYPYPNSIFLKSPGGSVSEAKKIAKLINTLAIDVAVAPTAEDGMCASSCFFIFMAGKARSADGIDSIERGTKGTLGPVGIHRPFFRSPGDGPTGAVAQEEMMASMREQLRKDGVPQVLVDKMISHASNDIYWLDSSDLHAIGKYSPGLEEQLIAKCNYNWKTQEAMNAQQWISDNEKGVGACVSSYLVETYAPIRKEAVSRMRGGWRPW